MVDAGPDGRGRQAALAAQLLLRLCYVGFVSLGLPDTVLGAAWPALREQLGLSLDTAGALLLVTTFGVVSSSSASGFLRARLGTASVLFISTLLAALGLLITALANSAAMLFLAALTAGLGGGAIDASLNHYVARHYSPRQLIWLHACWGVGAAVAPLVVASVLSAGGAWQFAYALLGGVELVLSLAMFATRRLWVEDAPVQASPAPASRGLNTSALASIALFYLYGGLEAGTGLWAATLLVGTRGLSQPAAGAVVGGYWAALTVGRFVSGAWTPRLGGPRVLRWSVRTALGACLLIALPTTPAWFVALGLGLLGFALASVYPLVMHDTPARFGAHASARLVGYQVAAATIGVATLPWLIGALAAWSSPKLLPACLSVFALLLALAERVRRTT